MSNISYYGIFTLIVHYIKTFFKEFYYTTISSIISCLLFIVILKTLVQYYNIQSNSNNFMQFIIPGIIMMIIIQETFGNISASIVWMKHHGTFDDILMSPISRVEIGLSFCISIWFIGLVIAIINMFVIYLVNEFIFFNIWRFFLYISLTSIFFASIGAIIGFLSYTWEIQQSFFNFIIAPISLLSGTFFSIEVVDEKWHNLFIANPFYHLISNARKSFTIEQTYNFKTDIILIILVFFALYISLYIFKKGYRVIH